jgi:hypothetical protein
MAPVHKYPLRWRPSRAALIRPGEAYRWVGVAAPEPVKRHELTIPFRWYLVPFFKLLNIAFTELSKRDSGW